jgi:hypothetical protein
MRGASSSDGAKSDAGDRRDLMKKNKSKEKVDQSLTEQISSTVNALLVVKARLPPILDLIEELKLVAQDEKVGVKNGIVLQMARDSFDMCVIDLASLRERMVQDTGILNQLRHHLERFLPRTPASFGGREVTWLGKADPVGLKAVQAHEQRLLAKYHHEALQRLFRGVPVTDSAVDALIQRFLDDTRAIDRDRNTVRAHRYEIPPNLAEKFYLEPKRVQSELKKFDRYLNDISLVVDSSTWAMEPLVYGNKKDAVEGMADLIVWGGINSACLKYEVTPERLESAPPEDSVRWYWAKRERYLNRRRTSAASDND